MITVEELITLLSLTPHPERGYYRETYRSAETIPDNVLPNRYKGDRSYGTAIYFLLTPDTFSALHRLKTNEVYHFYLGDPVEMLQLLPSPQAELSRLATRSRMGCIYRSQCHEGCSKGRDLFEAGNTLSWERLWPLDLNL